MKKSFSYISVGKRYSIPVLMVAGFGLFLSLIPHRSEMALTSFLNQGTTMLTVLPPIFLLLGLLDAWVPREVLIRHMGHQAGLKGGVLAFLLGSAAAGPLYGAFPIAAVLMAKGSSYRNVMIFLGAWSTTKIPMVLFEIASLGPRFALTRLGASVFGIIIIARAMEKLVPKDKQLCTMGSSSESSRQTQ